MRNAIPRLAERLILEAPTRSPDGGGGWQVTWTPLGTLWAEVRPVSARERVMGGRETSRITHRVRIPSAPVDSPRRPLPEQRFRQGSRIFDIRAVAEADDRHGYLVCWVEEGALP